MWANKILLISSPFALGLLILTVVVWIGVYGAFAEESIEAQEIAPIVPNAEKSAPKTEETTTEEDPAARERAVLGMSASDYGETQQRFLKGLNADTSEFDPWEDPYKPSEPPQRPEQVPEDSRAGDKVTFQSGNSVTLHSYESPVKSGERSRQPQPGKQFAAIDVEGCAGSNTEDGHTTLNPFYFSLKMSDNTRISLTAIPEIAGPEDLDYTTLKPGECVSGFVSFQVPQGETPSYVDMKHSMSHSTTEPPETAKWAVSSD